MRKFIYLFFFSLIIISCTSETVLNENFNLNNNNNLNNNDNNNNNEPLEDLTLIYFEDFKYYQADFWHKADFVVADFDSCFIPENIIFDDLNALLFLKLNNTPNNYNKNYSGAQYQSIDKYSYGIYEVKMRPSNISGVISSFFLYDEISKDEIDIEFLGRDSRLVQFNFYKEGIGGNEQLIDLNFDASSNYYTYKIDYQKEKIDFYINENLAHTYLNSTSKPIPNNSMKIMMNLWCKDSPSWAGNFSYLNEIRSSYDYVKIYKYNNM